jgi:hypothetical protein
VTAIRTPGETSGDFADQPQFTSIKEFNEEFLCRAAKGAAADTTKVSKVESFGG